jgi:methylmalonyl-CoA/ethylmalonyl-CoA epimerase
VAQRAEDLSRAVAFYRENLGAEVIEVFDPPGLAFLRLESPTRLLLDTGAPSALIYLGVDDVDAEVERLRGAGVTIETEAHTIFDDADGLFGLAGEEERMAFFRDSEGNLVGLVGRRRI